MFSKTTPILLLFSVSLSMEIFLSSYKDAKFDPFKTNDSLANLTSISSINICLCQCKDNSMCLTVNYFSVDQICSLYSAPLNQGWIRVVPTNVNATIVNFRNITTVINITTATNVMTTAITTITPNCSGTGLGSFFYERGSNGWIYFSKNYTATKLIHMLQFAVHGDSSETVFLDGVSVTNVNLPTIQLLINPSFEVSTLQLVGWNTWCTASCVGSGDGPRIRNSSCQDNSGNNCYTSHCDTGYDFLGQSFSTTIGNTYTISFWYSKTGGDNGKFYVDVK